MKDFYSLTLDFIKKYNDITIIEDNYWKSILKIEYGWGNTEEYHSFVVTLNYYKDTLNVIETVVGDDGDEYHNENTMKFYGQHDLYANFIRGIRECFD